ncbi:aminotransferase [Sarocladium strictum]
MAAQDPSLPSDLLTAVAQELRLSATLEINELVKKHQDQGRRVVHLGFGEATFPISDAVLKKHVEASQNTSYLPVAGLDKLRESIAKFQSRRLDVDIAAEQVVVAPGSKPLLFAFFDILQGDVLLPRPSWVSYEPQVKHAGKQVFWVETDEEDRHTITFESLKSSFDKAIAAGRRPRIMLINSPSNPTGQAFSESTLETIVTFCRENNITLISDEIYSDIYFSGGNCPSACAGKNFNAGQMILTGGLSKTYSAGGWRVGFAILPSTSFGNKLQTALLAYASECWSAASAPAQEAAAVAFAPTPEMDLYRQQVTQVHKACTLKLYSALKNLGLAVAEPKGAFYVYPSFHPYTAQLESAGIHTSVQLSRWLIEECGVAALPGSVFGEDDEGAKGGRYRLRMATSYLYFKNREERYSKGYKLLEKSMGEWFAEQVELPLLDEAIVALQKAVEKIKNL